MTSRTITALRQKFPFIPPEATVDHLVIGGGVVGLAIGRELVNKLRSKSTFVVERHPQPGQETSSRNSEVIHAGIYYPEDSLKTALCLRGRRLLYEYCQTHKIPHQKIGKLIISQSDIETEYLQRLYNKCQALNQLPDLRRAVLFGQISDRELDLAPLTILDRHKTLELEPNLSHDVSFSLLSPETGILDSHSFITSLENSIHNSDNGEVVYGSSVVRIDKSSTNDGWIVQTHTNSGETDEAGERNSVLAKCVVNCAGLNAHNIYNQVLYPKSLRLQLSFCKGSYYSYTSQKGVESVKHLIYPTPVKQRHQTSFVGLGTHLTIDMNRKIKFGPDVEWLITETYNSSMTNSQSNVESEVEDKKMNEELLDFWQKQLVPNDERLEMTHQSVKKYLPGVTKDYLSPDYSGIRPKLLAPGQNQNATNFHILSRLETDQPDKLLNDFYIRQTDHGFINLFGIESPGLSCSLSIAEFVRNLIQLEFWGLKLRNQSRTHETTSGIGNLDDWA